MEAAGSHHQFITGHTGFTPNTGPGGSLPWCRDYKTPVLVQSLCKSLGENQNHTKKYDFRDFRAVVPQPPQHSYNREFSSTYPTHARTTWDLHILYIGCTEPRRDIQRFLMRQDCQKSEVCMGKCIAWRSWRVKNLRASPLASVQPIFSIWRSQVVLV